MTYLHDVSEFLQDSCSFFFFPYFFDFYFIFEVKTKSFIFFNFFSDGMAGTPPDWYFDVIFALM